ERVPEGLKAELKLTKRALKEVNDEEWAYISPGLDVKEMPDGSLEPTDCFEISLTNTPMLDDQDRLAADRDGGSTMDTKKFAKLAGVAEDSSEDQILEALGKKLNPEKQAAGELSDKQIEVLAERLQGRLTEGILKGAEKTAEKMVEADRKARRVEMLLERAMKNGKAVAADRKVTVNGKEFDPLRIQCEADPDAFEAWEKNAVRKAPVAGAFPHEDLQDAITGDEQLPGAFAKVDLANHDTRLRLDRAAKALVAAKKAEDYSAAMLTLTRSQ
ncbi:MAG: phage protease, partial [Elusimicrobia bacterium]|nr:phage protease [Elusimicrobiota bacterium]